MSRIGWQDKGDHTEARITVTRRIATLDDKRVQTVQLPVQVEGKVYADGTVEDITAVIGDYEVELTEPEETRAHDALVAAWQAEAA